MVPSTCYLGTVDEIAAETKNNNGAVELRRRT